MCCTIVINLESATKDLMIITDHRAVSLMIGITNTVLRDVIASL